MSKAGKITAAISGAFLLLIVVAIILIATFDWNRLKPTINQKVSTELNRPFAIRGDLGVEWERQKQETGWRSWVPWPHVHAEDIILGNPPDIPEVTMVHLPRVEATLAPLALLTNSHFAELLDMLDERKIALNPAYELSFLKKEEQTQLLDAMDSEQATPSLSQAQRLKKFSQEGHLSIDVMRAIMGEEKKSDLDKVTFTSDTLRKYFPKSYTPQRMQETIIKLLEQWQKKRQRDQER